MKKYTKMMLMAAGRNRDTQDNYPRSEYDGARMNYEVESRFRDRRGREHYDDGRFAPMGNMREERNGRYSDRMAPRNDGIAVWNNGSDDPTDNWPLYPHIPPYGGNGSANRIGFELPSRTGNVVTIPMGAAAGRAGTSEMGMPSRSSKVFSPEMAEEWTEGLHNEDGTKGPHWKLEDVKRLMGQRGIQHDLYEFWAILNAIYSDYCGVLKKHNANNMDMYVDLASAWLNDKDSVPRKAAAYFEYVVK